MMWVARILSLKKHFGSRQMFKTMKFMFYKISPVLTFECELRLLIKNDQTGLLTFETFFLRDIHGAKEENEKQMEL